MKRFLAVAASFGLLLSGQSAIAEPFIFDPPYETWNGKNVFQIEETYSFGAPSAIKLSEATGPFRSAVRDCKELGVAPCLESLLDVPAHTGSGSRPVGTKELEFALTMPACEVAGSSNWCIEELRIYPAGSTALKAEFVRAVEGNTTKAIPSRDVPAGGTASLWRGAPGSGFEDLNLVAYGRAEIRKAFIFGEGHRYRTQEFALQVSPFTLNANRSSSIDFFDDPEIPGLGNHRIPTRGCLWQDGQGCGERADFPEGVRIGVTLRSNIPIAEFFNGRLTNPDLVVNQSAGITTLKIDAEPVVVPEIAAIYEESSGLRQKLKVPSAGWHSTKPFYQNAFEAISILRNHMGDKASGENTSWRLTSMGLGGTNRCYKDKGVAGMVFTNATTYEGEPPKYEAGFLNYKVAGMHYLSNGQDLFEGTYDLLIKSDVARCLYGFSSAPVSATVTVIGAAGAEKVASTQVSEKAGWLKLSAYGFTFSEKKIQVKLTQPQSRVLSAFTGRSSSLTNKQKTEVRTVLQKTAAKAKVTCTGLFSRASDRALALQRARATCSYVRSQNKSVSTFAQVKSTKAASSNGKVTVSSK